MSCIDMYKILHIPTAKYVYEFKHFTCRYEPKTFTDMESCLEYLDKQSKYYLDTCSNTGMIVLGMTPLKFTHNWVYDIRQHEFEIIEVSDV